MAMMKKSIGQIGSMANRSVAKKVALVSPQKFSMKMTDRLPAQKMSMPTKKPVTNLNSFAQGTVRAMSQPVPTKIGSAMSNVSTGALKRKLGLKGPLKTGDMIKRMNEMKNY